MEVYKSCKNLKQEQKLLKKNICMEKCFEVPPNQSVKVNIDYGTEYKRKPFVQITMECDDPDFDISYKLKERTLKYCVVNIENLGSKKHVGLLICEIKNLS